MKFTIDQNTTIASLGTQLAQLGGGAEKLLAKKDENGNIVLYTRDADLKGAKGNLTSGKDKFLSMFGKDKETLAKKTLSNLLKDFASETKADLLPKTRQVHGGREAVLKLDETIRFAASELKKGDLTTDSLTKTLASIELLAGTVTSIIDNKLEKTDTIPKLPATTNKVLDGTKELKEKDGTKHDIPRLEIGGKSFEPEKILGLGGYGLVVLYKADDDTKVAVKIPTHQDEDSIKERTLDARRELANTSRVMDGNPNVTGFNQHVMLPSGHVALIGEVMPNGDLMSLAKTLSGAVDKQGDQNNLPSGKIGVLEQKLIGLTLLQDTANGIALMNDEKGVSHGDLKSQNVMLDATGNAKVIDLGEAASTKNMQPVNYRFAQNLLYASPEADGQWKISQGRKDEVKSTNREMFTALTGSVFESLGFDPDNLGEATTQKGNKLSNLAKTMAKALDEMVLIKNDSDLGVSDTFDSFGMGTLAFELLVGGGLAMDDLDFSLSFSTAKFARIQQWAKSGDDFIGKGGLTQKSSGDASIDKLLNGMLRGDPAKRLPAADVRDDPLMLTPGVGSTEVRELILALAKGDAAAIDLARNKVRATFGGE